MSSGALAVLRAVVTACEVTCHVLGYIFPAYQTFKAIQADEVDGYTPWVTFWIVNSCFTVFEVFGGSVLSSKLPVYYPLKAILLAWLVLPRYKGAGVIYDRFVAPYLLQYEEDIDRKVEELQQKSGEAAGELAGVGLRAGAGVVKLGVAQVAKEVKLQVQDPTLLLRLLEEEEEVEEPKGGGKRKEKEKEKEKEKDKAKAEEKESKKRKGRSKKKKKQ